MTKQGVKGKYQRTLNEIDTNTHKTKSTNYNKVQVTWVGQLQFIVIHLVHYHTNAIRTGLRISLI